jgi:Cellulase (glycosyl hydrolase family 5)
VVHGKDEMPRRRFPVLAVAIAAVAFAAPAPALASSSQYTIFEAPTEMSSGDDALRQSTFDEIQAFGAKHIRVLLYWNSVVRDNNARSKPASLAERDPTSAGYDFSRYDAIINEAAARGIDVTLTVTGPVPRWATGRHRGHTYKPSRTRFARFVEAVGKRYGQQVNTWSVWNEPNHPDFLTPQFVKKKPYSPHLYRALYQAALQGLGASGNGSDTILAGETAPRGTPRVVAPVTFARIFFRGKKLKVSGYAHHPYTTKAGPFYKPADKDDVTIGVLSRLTKALDRYSHHHRLPVYLTEFGIQSKPDPYVGVSQTKQAEYRSIAERIAYRNSRVKAFSQYLMRDDKPRKGSRAIRYSGFESGLRSSSGKEKLAYKGFRLPLVADRTTSRKVTLWGLVRPTAGTTTVTLQYRNKGKSSWSTLKTAATNTRGYFKTTTRYRSGRTYRVRWTAPSGTAYTGPTTHAYRAP